MSLEIKMLLAIFCILISYFLGLSLAIQNLKRDRTKEIELRREYKKRKNEGLKRRMGL